MAYVTLAEFKTYMNDLTGGTQTSFSAQEDITLQVFLDQAVAEVESMTGRDFEATSGTRYYTSASVDGQRLYLGADLLSVTTLTNGNAATISGSNFTLEPRNSTVKDVIRLHDGYWWEFSTVDSVVTVLGSWGYSASPPVDLKRGVMRLAWFYWQKRGATGESTVLAEGVVQNAAAYPADVTGVIKRYRRMKVTT